MNFLISIAVLAFIGFIIYWVLVLRTHGKKWKALPPQNNTLVGTHGIARSALKPSGIAVVNGRRIDVVTEGDIIEAGKKIVITDVRPGRIIVAEIE